jgi:hypothetical protein
LALVASNSKEILKVQPAEKLTPELVAAIKEHKGDIVRIVREDEEMCRTSIIQSERQVFELASEYFGPSRPYDSAEHPPSKRELWVEPDKEAFFFPNRYTNGGGGAA